MLVFVNGERSEIEEPTNLEEFIERFSLPRQRIAVERNKEVVSRKDWGSTELKDGDRLEIVHFVGGG